MFVRIITIQLSIIWQNLAADSKSHDGLNLSYNKKKFWIHLIFWFCIFKAGTIQKIRQCSLHIIYILEIVY